MTDHANPSEAAAQEVEDFRYVMDNIRQQVGQVVVGQNEVVEHLLITLMVGGHCLITGMPGTAKTLLVSTLSEALGLEHNRIQFTPDLMPTDITGTDIISEDGSGQRQWSLPYTTKNTSCAARSDAGKLCASTRHYAPPATAVLCIGHPKPIRTGRHVPATRSTAGSLSI